MRSKCHGKKLKYAHERADATGHDYAISNMGHVMWADKANLKTMRDELLGIACIVKPRKRRR
jgi:hypothetical protein